MGFTEAEYTIDEIINKLVIPKQKVLVLQPPLVYYNAYPSVDALNTVVNISGAGVIKNIFFSSMGYTAQNGSAYWKQIVITIDGMSTIYYPITTVVTDGISVSTTGELDLYSYNTGVDMYWGARSPYLKSDVNRLKPIHFKNGFKLECYPYSTINGTTRTANSMSVKTIYSLYKDIE